MTDGIIKGTGNSRYLKSVANFMALYPTYEAFAQALIAGTLPVDLYGVNAGGWQVRGNDINKASLLKDATASLYGKGTTATVDDILAAIRPLITTAQNKADSAFDQVKISYGTYTGTGADSKLITVGFSFKFAFLWPMRSSGNTGATILGYNGAQNDGSVGASSGVTQQSDYMRNAYKYNVYVENKTNISFTVRSSDLNDNGMKYGYFVIGNN